MCSWYVASELLQPIDLRCTVFSSDLQPHMFPSVENQISEDEGILSSRRRHIEYSLKLCMLSHKRKILMEEEEKIKFVNTDMTAWIIKAETYSLVETYSTT